MSARQDGGYPPIGDYAIVGDCHTAALVARDGSVDWYCPGRFDAAAVFCRLLDARQGGFLGVAPVGRSNARRAYRGHTNVLETTFDADGGRVRLTDFMPVGAGGRQLLRLAEGLDGELDLEVTFKPTFDFARQPSPPSVVPGGATAGAGGEQLVLACRGLDPEFAPDGAGAVRGRLHVRAGDRRWLALRAGAAGDRLDPPSPDACDAALARTLAFWERWANACTYRGPYREQVLRSALALKLLIYEPTGAVLAAPTTSLPERIGGERNWDYRFSWLRDSSLILYALMTVGYANEAAEFIHWLERTVGSDPTRAPQIMYGIDGRRELAEHMLDHLDGYRSSRPVRIGNAAYTQRQLDIYGEVLAAAYLHYRRGRQRQGDTTAEARRQPSAEAWPVFRGLVQQAAEHWQEPGNGIWEVRGPPRQFLYGKLMCWAALDRGVRLAREHGLDAPVGDWQRTRAEIRDAILSQGYNAEIGAFTQAFGSTPLDADALVIPRVGLLAPTDPRVQSTVELIRRQLTQDGLVYRYRTSDGLAGGEATFALCTFWLVEALALGGRLEEAGELFEHVLTYTNDVGLLSEEIDPSRRELLGNFPQGFSHLAVIGAAVNLAKAAKHGPEQEPQTEAERAGDASQAASGT
jgi:alpha,alpha-trehalase